MFDPTKPAASSPLSSAEMREQLQGLHDLILSIPVGQPGPEGPMGPMGQMVNNATVDGVASVPAGNASAASAFVDGGGTIRFQFQLVEGPTGPPGEVTTNQLQNELANTQNAAVLQALAQSANNSTPVATLDVPLATGELELLRQKVNELILALRR